MLALSANVFMYATFKQHMMSSSNKTVHHIALAKYY